MTEKETYVQAAMKVLGHTRDFAETCYDEMVDPSPEARLRLLTGIAQVVERVAGDGKATP